MTFKKFGLLIPHEDLRPLLTVQKEREHTEMMKETFGESSPKFNHYQETSFNTIFRTVFPGLTSS